MKARCIQRPRAEPKCVANQLSNLDIVSSPVCRQVRNGAQAIFGPADATIAAHVQSICDALDIPHLQSRIDVEPDAAAADAAASDATSEASGAAAAADAPTVTDEPEPETAAVGKNGADAADIGSER